MRKGLIIGLAVAMVVAFTGTAMASNTAGWTFNVEVQVEPMIQKNCSLPSVMKMKSLEQDQEQVGPQDLGWNEAFYANVPFSKTFSGNNPAGDLYPIFARQELDKSGAGIAGRYDRLSTKITFETVVNGLGSDPYREDLSVVFGCQTQNSVGIPPPIPGYAYWWWGRNSLTFGTPHDGEVWEKFFVKADRKMPDFTIDNAWYENADAGIYELTITETLVGLNTAQSSDAYVTHP